MSKLSEWALKERKTELSIWHFKEGTDAVVEFDETSFPRENISNPSKPYANFRVTVNGVEMLLGQRKDLQSYRYIIKYLSAEQYILRFVWAVGGQIEIYPVEGKSYIEEKISEET